MKKGLMTFLFALAAFLVVGVSSVSAQKYVSEAQAISIVADQISDLQSEGEIIGQQTTDFSRKLKFLNITLQNLQSGNNVTSAVKLAYQSLTLKAKPTKANRDVEVLKQAFESIGTQLLRDLEI
jgi:hypothetical protein